MKSFLKNRIVLLVFRIILGLIFIAAGIEKIANAENFALSIENYKLLPIQIINLFAITLPWLELITGLLLLFGVAVKENSLIINTLLAIFILLILSAVLRGLDIDCGCFGTSDGQKVGVVKITENFLLLVIGIIVFKYDDHPLSINTG
jgi:uncharacterized membrane protein YphA (DoxX/SURF4 family)